METQGARGQRLLFITGTPKRCDCDPDLRVQGKATQELSRLRQVGQSQRVEVQRCKKSCRRVVGVFVRVTWTTFSSNTFAARHCAASRATASGSPAGSLSTTRPKMFPSIETAAFAILFSATRRHEPWAGEGASANELVVLVGRRSQVPRLARFPLLRLLEQARRFRPGATGASTRHGQTGKGAEMPLETVIQRIPIVMHRELHPPFCPARIFGAYEMGRKNRKVAVIEESNSRRCWCEASRVKSIHRWKRTRRTKLLDCQQVQESPPLLIEEFCSFRCEGVIEEASKCGQLQVRLCCATTLRPLLPAVCSARCQRRTSQNHRGWC